MPKTAAGDTIGKAEPSPRRFLRIGKVVEMTGIPPSSIYSMMAEDKFPRSIPLSGRIKAFLEEEVQAWMEERIKDRERAA
ncbi:MAG: helix-turn-helix transcriptional regulator [Methyloceanibacter sp.]|uniref:helix-turn-helix transcriptional regulator n=1 Tax=Methyloceanibacter sp. TaxID=1965321 RepID=UPI003D9BBB62